MYTWSIRKDRRVKLVAWVDAFRTGGALMRIVLAAAMTTGLILATTAQGQTFSTLVNFDLTDGANPLAALVQGADGNLYGTAYLGGANDRGAVFKLTPAGVLTTYHSFDGSDGQNPAGGLVLGNSGNLLGTAYVGGAYGQDMNGYGTVFKISPDGNFSTLQSFNGTDGQNPEAGVALGNDGDCYGTTRLGGSNGDGAVFKITAAGVLTTLHNFDLSDGEWPIGGLALGYDGNLYGTTYTGGANFVGTIFRVTPSGIFTTLHNFGGADGNGSVGTLVVGNDGSLYGTTDGGGANNYGSVFRITPNGAFAVLHSFDGTDGDGPAGLTLGNDGNFYGTTSNGGANNDGTIFQITTAGDVTVLHSFDATDGMNPYSALVQRTSGIFYGTTYSGGKEGYGTIFSLNVGLEPFAALEIYSGKAGQTVGVLGEGLAGTKAVFFNGLASKFSVISDTYLTAVVPVGATSGFVRIATPAGTLASNRKFSVR
jgi:uncharacterized repeat protein (TIGR03803 family)